MEIRWNQIIGHENGIDRLRRMAKEDRVPHAMLFTGQAGIGKRLVAQVLAAGLLCHNSVDGQACGQCQSCKAMLSGTHPDYHVYVPMTKNEWERKKEKSKSARRIIRVEQIQELQSKLSMVPAFGHGSIAVIDGAETMDAPVANRILKTIEEPQGQVVFILLTSRPDSLLDTIISRCTRIEFGILSHAQIQSYLQKQGLYQDKAITLSALADGSIGRALSLNDDEIIKLSDDVWSLLDALPAMEMDSLWQYGKSLGELGRDKTDEWLGFLAMIFRDLLVLYAGGSVELYNGYSMDKLNKLLPRYSCQAVESMLLQVRDIQYRIRYNVSLRLQLESLLIRLKDCCSS